MISFQTDKPNAQVIYPCAVLARNGAMLRLMMTGRPIPHWIGGNRKTLSTIVERGSKIDRNSVFDCHLSPVGRQMAIENTVPIDF